MTWPEATAAVVGVIVVGFLLALVLIRDHRSRHVRFGVFVERDVSPRQDEWPTTNRDE